jgi:hypothetical protein
MVKLGFPNNFGQYAALASAAPGTGQGTVSDGTLTILNSSMHPNVEVIFRDMFPISISDANFTSTDTTVDYVTATVEFKYTYLTFNKL